MKHFALFRVFAAVAALLASSCVSNLGHLQPFSQYQGKTVTLLRECNLYWCTAWMGGEASMWFTGPSTNAVCLVPVESKFYAHTRDGLLYTLSPGSRVTIKTIRNVIVESFSGVEVLGEVTIDSGVVRFLYQWGDRDYLERAPWEPLGVPEERYVGYRGDAYHKAVGPRGGR
jgi:hypothetical protein